MEIPALPNLQELQRLSQSLSAPLIALPNLQKTIAFAIRSVDRSVDLPNLTKATTKPTKITVFETFGQPTG